MHYITITNIKVIIVLITLNMHAENVKRYSIVAYNDQYIL